MKKGVIAVISVLTGVALGIVGDGYYKNKIISQNNNRVNKFKSYYNILNQWIVLQHEGKKIEQFFINNGYSKIAIYGMGEIGNRLFEELKDSSIEVKYAIDKNADNTYSQIEVYTLDDDLEEVDAIIVTTAFAFVEIKNSLEQKVNYPIISLEDVVYEI